MLDPAPDNRATQTAADKPVYRGETEKSTDLFLFFFSLN